MRSQSPLGGKSLFSTLSPNEWGEGQGEGHLPEFFSVSPLTAAMRHPVFPDLRKAERDSILSPPHLKDGGIFDKGRGI
jgi:hypothetical protein